MSQPAVTQNIHGLEQSLGVPLFERLGRRIDLTPAGQALLPYVSRIDALLEEAVATAREAGGLASRTLRLGAGDTVATYILPDLIRTFSKRRPHATLHLVVGKHRAGDGSHIGKRGRGSYLGSTGAASDVGSSAVHHGADGGRYAQ